MTEFRRYHHPAPPGSLVVRIVTTGGALFGFIREINEGDDTDDAYPSEQKPLDQVWRLVANKVKAEPGTDVLVDLEPGIEWDPHWGRLA
mgnify:CR=1 FL=1|jgi:hypothetical protein